MVTTSPFVGARRSEAASRSGARSTVDQLWDWRGVRQRRSQGAGRTDRAPRQPRWPSHLVGVDLSVVRNLEQRPEPASENGRGGRHRSRSGPLTHIDNGNRYPVAAQPLAQRSRDKPVGVVQALAGARHGQNRARPDVLQPRGSGRPQPIRSGRQLLQRRVSSVDHGHRPSAELHQSPTLLGCGARQPRRRVRQAHDLPGQGSDCLGRARPLQTSRRQDRAMAKTGQRCRRWRRPG